MATKKKAPSPPPIVKPKRDYAKGARVGTGNPHAPGGKRAGAGRPKGAVDKGPKGKKEKAAAIEAQIDLAEFSGLTPLEFMLNTMRDPKLDIGTRLMAARDAAPYVHARLQAITIKGDPTAPVATSTLTPAQYREIVTEALRKI